MPSKYKFSDDEIRNIENARIMSTNKRAEARLKALELRAKGMELKAVSEETGFHPGYITALVRKYRKNGLEAISGNHYIGGNRRNMSIEKEAEILAPFRDRAEKGDIIKTSEIRAAYQAAVHHRIGSSQIYFVLKRHNWPYLNSRKKHPLKDGKEDI